MKIIIRTLIAVTLVTIAVACSNEATTSDVSLSGELMQWHKVTLTFIGPNTSETARFNPFLDYSLNVTFTQGPVTYVIPGYYCANGEAGNTGASSGNKWRVHFAPPSTGKWKWQAAFKKGASIAVSDEGGISTHFDGESGSFNVAASDKTGKDFRGKGLIKLASGKHYLQFSGTEQYWIKGGTDCPGDPAQSVKIVLSPQAGAVAHRASEILAREITERSGAKVSTDGKADFTVELAVQSGIGTEGFTIADNGRGILKITGNDENGLLYGVGKFLHTCRYDQGGFTPGDWRGTSVPKGRFRGIYFATHFNNWYEAASDSERARYVESLALWGTNSLVVHYPDQWLSGIDDPKARAWIQKMKRLMADARSVGINVGLLHIVNAGYTSTPKELMATPGSHCGGQMICPSRPEGKNLLMRNWNALMSEFADPGLDLVVYWPYDEGGCNCAQCRPWGGNGYLDLCRDFSTVVREKYPEARIILSTWCFDYRHNPEWKTHVASIENGEYAALAKTLAEDKSWVDGIMSDAHGSFPEYPLLHGVPGDLPMVNFSEISMIGQYPWGGFGANPLPGRLQRLWNEAKDKLSGGFPYSEGIFEDINKAICSQLYWAPDKPTMETVKEYIAYEYSPGVVDSVAKAIGLLEQNHMRKLVVEKKEKPDADWFSENTFIGGSRIAFVHADQMPLTEAEMKDLKKNTEEAFRLIDGADKQLTPQVRASWRWRILYLRAVIDRELVKTDGWFEGPELKSAFEEMTRISYSEHGFTGIHVPRIDDPNVKYLKSGK